MSTVEIDWDGDGIRELFKGDQMWAAMGEEARRIATAASSDIAAHVVGGDGLVNDHAVGFQKSLPNCVVGIVVTGNPAAARTVTAHPEIFLNAIE